MTKNEFARKHAVPKMFRQYSKRYGTGVEEMVRMQTQVEAPMLDHWRDRLLRIKKLPCD